MNKEFWKALLFRTIKTWCQAFIGYVGIDSGGRSLTDVDWAMALSVATLAAIICFVWNLSIGLPEVKLAETLYALDNDPYNEEEDDEEDDETDEEV